jgi:hypothetical protein
MGSGSVSFMYHTLLQKAARLVHCNFAKNTLFFFILWETPTAQDVPPPH